MKTPRAQGKVPGHRSFIGECPLSLRGPYSYIREARNTPSCTLMPHTLTHRQNKKRQKKEKANRHHQAQAAVGLLLPSARQCLLACLPASTGPTVSHGKLCTGRQAGRKKASSRMLQLLKEEDDVHSIIAPVGQPRSGRAPCQRVLSFLSRLPGST